MSASLILVAMFGGAVIVTALSLSSLIKSSLSGYGEDYYDQADNSDDADWLHKLIDPDFLMAASAFSIALVITSMR